MILIIFCMYFFNEPNKYVVLFRMIINTSFYCIILYILFAPFKTCSIFVR